MLDFIFSSAAEQKDSGFENRIEAGEEAITATTSSKQKMAGGSKESRKSASDDSIFSLVYTVVKKVTVVGAIYLVGYMGWSVAWLITPIIFAVTREQWRKTSELRRSIAKASATSNEKDVILARIDDLPAWVSFFNKKENKI